MDIENVTRCYQGIQRIYRNAVVQRVRQRFTELFGDAAIEKVKAPFKKEWDEVVTAANESRASGELSAPLRDEFDLLGVNHFYSIFDAYFDELFPDHLDRPKKEKSLAKQAVLAWTRTIKNLRDCLSHPAEADFGLDDARQMLYSARHVLDAMQLFHEVRQVLEIERSLDSDAHDDLLIVKLPPADEVVTHFVGRKPEMLHLRRWIDDSSSPRWALAGDGGKGKSAIAYSFAKEVSQTGASGVSAVIWLSAKKRRFRHGQTTVVNRPDFYDKQSVIMALLGAFGEATAGDDAADESELRVLSWLNDFPTLIVIDDIDTLEGEGLEAIPFLTDLPVRTKAKILITSRRTLFGLETCTTSVSGLSEQDARSFITSRCELMGIEPLSVMKYLTTILAATDSSPLYIEDLLRLTLAGLTVDKAIGLWQQRRGAAAREYSIQREFESLPDDAKEVLFVLSLMERPCSFEELRSALEWHADRVVEAQQSLRQMFLMPRIVQGDGDAQLSLNNNTKILVKDVFSKSARFERVQRQVKGILGHLETTAAENQRVTSVIGAARAHVSRLFHEHGDATAAIARAIEQMLELEGTYPGRSDIPAMIGWLYKKERKWTDAREAFRRAVALQSKDTQMFWHWSDMEMGEEEWEEAIRVAEIGRAIAPSDQSLLYCLAYSQNRRGCELARGGQQSSAVALLKKAEHALRAFIENSSAGTSFLQQSRAYRSLVHNADARADGKAVAKYLLDWVKFSPEDWNLRREYDRMRVRFPEHVPPAEQVFQHEWRSTSQ